MCQKQDGSRGTVKVSWKVLIFGQVDFLDKSNILGKVQLGCFCSPRPFVIHKEFLSWYTIKYYVMLCKGQLKHPTHST